MQSKLYGCNKENVSLTLFILICFISLHIQVVKYRPGGTSLPHVDYYQEEAKEEGYNLGNRCGHAMIFLSDVKLGGGFAMPELGIHISPKPGRMVVWHNLDKNGEPDPRSLHGGCRVFSGNKVMAIKDFHQLNQNNWTCKKKKNIMERLNCEKLTYKSFL